MIENIFIDLLLGGAADAAFKGELSHESEIWIGEIITLRHEQFCATLGEYSRTQGQHRSALVALRGHLWTCLECRPHLERIIGSSHDEQSKPCERGEWLHDRVMQEVRKRLRREGINVPTWAKARRRLP